jgi:hypothetical protein
MWVRAYSEAGDAIVLRWTNWLNRRRCALLKKNEARTDHARFSSGPENKLAVAHVRLQQAPAHIQPHFLANMENLHVGLMFF